MADDTTQQSPFDISSVSLEELLAEMLKRRDEFQLGAGQTGVPLAGPLSEQAMMAKVGSIAPYMDPGGLAKGMMPPQAPSGPFIQMLPPNYNRPYQMAAITSLINNFVRGRQINDLLKQLGATDAGGR